MLITTVIQRATSSDSIPSDADIDDWIRKSLQFANYENVEITLRVVDEAEIEKLNSSYRHAHSPTDVLAFSYPPKVESESTLLGDVVVCAGLVNQYANTLNTPPAVHWARIVAHGVLHLCGYDHHQTADAANMESKERKILEDFGFVHPDLINAAP